MTAGSAATGLRRVEASPCKGCARVALLAAWTFVVLPHHSLADPPVLQPPAVNEKTEQFTAAASATAPVKTVSVPAPPKREDLTDALERRGDLNLHGLSLNAALFMISEQWNINIVAGDVKGTVNGVFKHAPLREILDSILLSNGYNYRLVGHSLVVSSIADLGQINPFFQSATIAVRTADIDEVVEGAKLLNTPQGQVRALKSAGSIVVLDFPDRVELIRQFVAAIDGASGGDVSDPGGGRTLEVGHFRTQYITARAAEQALQVVLSKDGRAAVMEKEDRLVVADHAANLAMVEKVLQRIDRPRPQVRITALIYDISLQDVERLGLNWNKLGYSSGNSSADLAVATAPFDSLTLIDGALTSLTAGPGNIAFGTLSDKFDINAVVHALQQARDARLLADPNVAVLENEQAVFRSVREIPIQQLTETQQGGNIGTTAFRDAGITLTVVPKIACDGTISMEVAPEFSRHVGNDSNGQPIIDTREAKTTLRVANRQTVVIGGLRQRDDIGEFNGIPYLKDIKGVGRLFRSRNITVRESELVVFIMPEIIDYADVPNRRQQTVVDTVDCRLSQIPEAEGCPPCCRRLPPELCGPEASGVLEVLPSPGPDEEEAEVVLPLSASVRRLPAVGPAESRMVAGAQLRGLFPAPTVNADDDQLRTAERELAPVRR
jgi:general secretion pathway protein D